jgi:hypothetical protein
MCRIELKAFWKRKNLIVDRVVQGFGISFLEVGATTAPDE